MRIGTLRHRVTLQEYVKGKDAYGGMTQEWVERGTVWASFEAMSGTEFFASQQAQSQVTQRVRIRYRSGLKSLSWRLCTQDGRLYNIISILPDNTRQTMVLMCQEASYEQTVQR